MFRILTALTLCALWAGSAQAGVTRESIRVGGETRSFLIFTPDTPARPGGRPLVLVLHGGGGTGREVMRSTGGRFNDLAAANGALVAYPDAVRRIWDFGEGTISDGLRERHDDFAFLTGMVRSVTARHGGNPGRVYATGISRGGQASYFLACKAPELFAAVAPVSMSLPDFLVDDCRRSPAIPILVMNGTEDPIVPYAGGPIVLFGKERGDVLSTDATLDRFRRKNGCTTHTVTRRIGAVDRVEWQGCGAPTVLYRVNGGGHTWPGRNRNALGRTVGAKNTDIRAPDEIWHFFFR